MFDSKYYKTRFIYQLEGSEYKALVEPNYHRNEVFVFLPDEQKQGEYLICLRKLHKKPLDSDRMIALDSFLLENGYTDLDFVNPFNRTKKIVQVLDVINNLEKTTEKIKIKK